MTKNDYENIKKKFEIAYFTAKQELPLTLFTELVKLEEHHGVDLGLAYRNAFQCGQFIDYISETLSNELKEIVDKVNFISVLWDGATDSAVQEREALLVQYLDIESAIDTIEIKTKFLGLPFVRYSNAKGVASIIKSGFEDIGIVLHFVSLMKINYLI